MTAEHLFFHVSSAETEAKKIGLKIRMLRDQRGMTRAELGRRCGIARVNIFRMETGLTFPTFVNVCKILAAMEYSLEDIIETEK